MKKIIGLAFLLVFFPLVGYTQDTVKQSTGLMAEPALTAKRITTVYEGENVSLIEKTGEFWKVYYKKKTGYIHETCLSNYVDLNPKQQEKDTKDIQEIKPVIQDSAEILISTWGRFLYKGNYVRAPQLMNIVKDNPVAKSTLKGAYVLYSAGILSAGIFGGVIGYEMGMGGITSNGLLVIVTFMGAATVFNLLSSNQFKKVVEIYNQDIRVKGLGKIVMKIGIAEHGYGLSLSF